MTKTDLKLEEDPYLRLGNITKFADKYQALE